jgi:uncharacterized coiled-coil DUF342 family protein
MNLIKKGYQMDALRVLEHKITALAALVKDMKSQNEQLHAENARLLAESVDLKAENARLAEEAGQLSAKLETMEGSMLMGFEQLNVMSKEKELTKVVVDDLIRSIDSLVKRENQQ